MASMIVDDVPRSASAADAAAAVTSIEMVLAALEPGAAQPNGGPAAAAVDAQSKSLGADSLLRPVSSRAARRPTCCPPPQSPDPKSARRFFRTSRRREGRAAPPRAAPKKERQPAWLLQLQVQAPLGPTGGSRSRAGEHLRTVNGFASLSPSRNFHFPVAPRSPSPPRASPFPFAPGPGLPRGPNLLLFLLHPEPSE